MPSKSGGTEEYLDEEWMDLIQMAIKLEIPLEEIKSFLSNPKQYT
jgi:DNA-binding transcriptional MerR regulator